MAVVLRSDTGRYHAHCDVCGCNGEPGCTEEMTVWKWMRLHDWLILTLTDECPACADRPDRDQTRKGLQCPRTST